MQTKRSQPEVAARPQPAYAATAFPPAFCGGLIEAQDFSALETGDAFCGGLIEARPTRHDGCYSPPLFAGASLKLCVASSCVLSPASRRYSPPLFAGASLKPGFFDALENGRLNSPPLFAGASLKPGQRRASAARRCYSPPLFAGASLKLCVMHLHVWVSLGFPPAFCGGLIEARARRRS